MFQAKICKKKASTHSRKSFIRSNHIKTLKVSCSCRRSNWHQLLPRSPRYLDRIMLRHTTQYSYAWMETSWPSVFAFAPINFLMVTTFISFAFSISNWDIVVINSTLSCYLPQQFIKSVVTGIACKFSLVVKRKSRSNLIVCVQNWNCLKGLQPLKKVLRRSRFSEHIKSPLCSLLEIKLWWIMDVRAQSEFVA